MTVNLPQAVDHALLRKGWTIPQAADAAGVGANTMRRLRNGEQVHRNTVGKIAAALEIDAVELYDALTPEQDRSAA